MEWIEKGREDTGRSGLEVGGGVGKMGRTGTGGEDEKDDDGTSDGVGGGVGRIGGTTGTSGGDEEIVGVPVDRRWAMTMSRMAFFSSLGPDLGSLLAVIHCLIRS